MNLKKVLFIGGDPDRLPSVRIRCVDIAYRLGCDCIFKIRPIEDIPRYYQAFVCVKSSIDPLQLRKLQKRGVVIWDVIDALPPKRGVDVYLASSQFAQKSFAAYGRAELIHNHHCNESGKPNSPRLDRQPVWIGGRHWCPKIPGVKFKKHFVENLPQADVVRLLRQVGIGLNFRGGSAIGGTGTPESLFHDFHVSINPGIKLINCLGFGTPSISGDEPAYHEIGEGCTIFSSPADCRHWVKELQKNDRLYRQLRRNCLKQASRFHLDAIAAEYRRLLDAL